MFTVARAIEVLTVLQKLNVIRSFVIIVIGTAAVKLAHNVTDLSIRLFRFPRDKGCAFDRAYRVHDDMHPAIWFTYFIKFHSFLIYDTSVCAL